MIKQPAEHLQALLDALARGRGDPDALLVRDALALDQLLEQAVDSPAAFELLSFLSLNLVPVSQSKKDQRSRLCKKLKEVLKHALALLDQPDKAMPKAAATLISRKYWPVSAQSDLPEAPIDRSSTGCSPDNPAQKREGRDESGDSDPG